MPRGSVPWPRRDGCRVAARGGRDVGPPRPADVEPAAASSTATTDDRGEEALAADVTVHLVDACGRVVDVRPVPPEADATASSGEHSGAEPVVAVDGVGGRGESEDHRRKGATAVPAAGCRSLVRGEHIPPGKLAA